LGALNFPISIIMSSNRRRIAAHGVGPLRSGADNSLKPGAPALLCQSSTAQSTVSIWVRIKSPGSHAVALQGPNREVNVVVG
jgi:hypothetical protein